MRAYFMDEKLVQTLMERDYKQKPITSKELIRLVETSNILETPIKSKYWLKRALLDRLGYETVMQSNTLVKLEIANPETVHEHLRAAYYSALREEGKI
jgi:hypothetical protein